MTQQPTILFDQAELALAAYANLVRGPTGDQTTALVEAGMSLNQAIEFAKRYTDVVIQFDDITETGKSSFNATVFKDESGNLTLAIRGTQELPDFIPTDLDIWQRGAGHDQIVALYNWWQRVSGSATVRAGRGGFYFRLPAGRPYQRWQRP